MIRGDLAEIEIHFQSWEEKSISVGSCGWWGVSFNWAHSLCYVFTIEGAFLLAAYHLSLGSIHHTSPEYSEQVEFIVHKYQLGVI